MRREHVSLMPDNDAVRKVLSELAECLDANGLSFHADMTRKALSDTPEELDAFLVSNSLWGGSGSIADQAGCDCSPELQNRVFGVLVRLGDLLVQLGKDTPRSRMITDIHRHWLEKNGNTIFLINWAPPGDTPTPR